MSRRRDLSPGRHRADARRVSGSGRQGAVHVSEVQRARMLSSAVQVVSEHGYGRMSVARVAGGARVSRRTFYDVFEDREDCFLAALNEALARSEGLVRDAYAGEGGAWREKVRAALGALLTFFDDHPEMGSLLVVNALRAGPKVLKRRAGILERLSTLLHESGSRAKTGRRVPELTGESVVSAVVGVIHSRLSSERPEQLADLLGPLMGVIVLPYEGSAAAQRELQRPTPQTPRTSKRASRGSVSRSSGDPFVDLPMRLTYRTLRVLAAIGEQPDASNREVANVAGVTDQGQMSKLLTRLEKLALVENGTEQNHQPTGEPNAWRLTPRGEAIERATRVTDVI
jgi:AcrR family transcriptional regulator